GELADEPLAALALGGVDGRRGDGRQAAGHDQLLQRLDPRQEAAAQRLALVETGLEAEELTQAAGEHRRLDEAPAPGPAKAKQARTPCHKEGLSLARAPGAAPAPEKRPTNPGVRPQDALTLPGSFALSRENCDK